MAGVLALAGGEPLRSLPYPEWPTADGRERELLLEVDAKQRIAGLWFLNVPPFPAP